MRNILLIEPNYKNKYPPLGLMKISAFHKGLGDRVVFFKGKSQDLRDFIWDKIYITTLFTFHWKITLDTIKYYKRSIYHTDNIYIGGIMASLLQKEVYDEVRIKPYFGLLTSAKSIGENSEKNIDLIYPDYDILDEIDYKYPANNAYFTNTTKGCTRKCKFCAVPTLEPKFIKRQKIKEQIDYINKKFGDKKNMLLMDNNVLASKCFNEIIDEIKAIGFEKGALFVDPIMYEVYMNRIKDEHNKFEIEKTRQKIIKEIDNIQKRIKSRESMKKYKEIIGLFNINQDTNIEDLFKAYPVLMPIFNKYHNKTPKERFVDYNQGVDLRYLTEEKIKKFSEINIKPLRIAFDHISLKDKYVEACELADKYNIKELSNYLLYNYKDKPEELYERLKINIDLNERFRNTTIYSFPMKYIPVNETDRKKYIAKDWSLKAIRTIQAISNVTKGVIGAGKSFFEKAFGSNLEEFMKLILMPEDYIIYRFENEKNGNTATWWNQYVNLKPEQKKTVNNIVFKNDFKNIDSIAKDEDIITVLKHYQRKRESAKKKKKTVKTKTVNKLQLTLF